MNVRTKLLVLNVIIPAGSVSIMLITRLSAVTVQGDRFGQLFSDYMSSGLLKRLNEEVDQFKTE